MLCRCCSFGVRWLKDAKAGVGAGAEGLPDLRRKARLVRSVAGVGEGGCLVRSSTGEGQQSTEPREKHG